MDLSEKQEQNLAKTDFSMDFFSQFSTDFRKDFQKSAMRKQFAAGTQILIENDNCEVLPIVLSGSIRVYKSSESGKELTLYHIDKDESCVLTSLSLINEYPFPANATIEKDAEVYLVSGKVFLSWMEKYSEWRSYIYQMMNKRIVSLLLIVQEVAFRKMDERILSYLTRKFQDEGNSLTLTHEQISLDLGTAREVVSRLLKDLSDKGNISLQRGKIEKLKNF
jgi:CRP/FNR family transcriptional regulator